MFRIARKNDMFVTNKQISAEKYGGETQDDGNCCTGLH